MTRPAWAITIGVLGVVIALNAQNTPPLGDYFTLAPPQTLDADYAAHFITEPPYAADLDGDGNDDLVILGVEYAVNGITAETFRPQPSRVFLGDGAGNFTPA